MFVHKASLIVLSVWAFHFGVCSSEKDNEVETHLGETVFSMVTNNLKKKTPDTGSTVEEEAREWFKVVLTKDWSVPSEAKPLFSDPSKNRIDTIGFSYTIQGKDVEARQTASSWQLAVARKEKDSLSTANLSNFAKTVIQDFDGLFVFQRKIKNTAFYSFQATAEARKAKWTDQIILIVEKKRIVLLGLKKQPLQQFVPSFYFKDNVNWFESINKNKEGSK